MITKKDVEVLKEVFVTKYDLRDELQRFATRDEMLTFKDEILYQIMAMRDEISVVLGYKSNIDDHETRIEKLENEVLTNKPI